MAKPNSSLKWMVQRPMTWFLVWSLLAVGVSLLLYWAVSSKHWPTAPTTDDPATSLVDILLGPAISLAGALVAIVLAAYAVRLQEQAHRRETLQSQVDLLKLTTEQTAPFLLAYAKCLVHVRQLIGYLELNHDTLVKPVVNPSVAQEVTQYGQDLTPLVTMMTNELNALAAQLDELHSVASTDPFSAAIYRKTFGAREWRVGAEPNSPTIPLNALPSVALLLRLHSKRLETLMHGPNGSYDLGLLVIQSRGAGAECHSHEGVQLNHTLIRAALIQGFIFDNTITNSALGSGVDLRPPLTELVFTLMSVVDANGVQSALRDLFNQNELLEPIIDQVGLFLPEPLDPTLKEPLETYRIKRPRLKMVNGIFV